MAEPGELRARAEGLRRLADDVDGLVAPSRRRAAEPVWQCPHAEQVRAALEEQTRAAATSARRLREHAQSLDAQAARIEAEREAQRRAEQQRAEQQRAEQQRGREAEGRPAR